MRQGTWQDVVCAGEMCGSLVWSSRRIPVAFEIYNSSGCTEDCCALRECYCLHTSIRASLEVHTAVFFSVCFPHIAVEWAALLFLQTSFLLLMAGWVLRCSGKNVCIRMLSVVVHCRSACNISTPNHLLGNTQCVFNKWKILNRRTSFLDN